MRRLPATAIAIAAIAAVGTGAGTAFAAGTSSPTTAKTPATAKGPATLQQVQAKAAAAVTARVNAINAEIAKVQAAKDLGSDQATLLKTLQGDVTGLRALGQKIAGDPTVTAAKADAETILTDYRVFALAMPVSRLVVAADRFDATVIPKLTTLQGKLAARVTSTTSAQVTPLLNDLTAQLAAVGTATKGLSAQLLSLTPAAWNSNHSVLDQPRAAVKTAAGDLKKAVADAKQARSDLRAARPAA